MQFKSVNQHVTFHSILSTTETKQYPFISAAAKIDQRADATNERPAAALNDRASGATHDRLVVAANDNPAAAINDRAADATHDRLATAICDSTTAVRSRKQIRSQTNPQTRPYIGCSGSGLPLSFDSDQDIVSDHFYMVAKQHHLLI
ncbi:hypothetical protein GJ496_001158 [Pomphorhynchus laevis]|nr:hypothetical protein GJ496_001158 [Pomphorhynchus laevis]